MNNQGHDLSESIIAIHEQILCVRDTRRLLACVHKLKPLNKGQIGDNINSAVLSFVERLSSSRRFKMYWNYRGRIIWGGMRAVLLLQPSSFVERYIMIFLCPYLGGSTIRGLIA